MEVYLNVAETGIGTYGVNAGAQRYFGHDASRDEPEEAARIAAVLPLPEEPRGGRPEGFTRRYGNIISARIRRGRPRRARRLRLQGRGDNRLTRRRPRSQNRRGRCLGRNMKAPKVLPPVYSRTS